MIINKSKYFIFQQAKKHIFKIKNYKGFYFYLYY